MLRMMNYLVPTLYRQLVESLIYLTVTCPNITHVVHIVSRFRVALRTTHYTAVVQILHYVKAPYFIDYIVHITLHLSYMNTQMLTGVASYSRCSTMGFCLFFCASPISWRSTKQSPASKSSAKSEYRALTNTTYE